MYICICMYIYIYKSIFVLNYGIGYERTWESLPVHHLFCCMSGQRADGVSWSIALGAF